MPSTQPADTPTQASSTPQAGQLDHYELVAATNETAALLADALAARLPADLQRVFFANSGSEAVEAAIRAALEYQRLTGHPQRRALLSFQLSYHGSTALALALSGLPQTETPYNPPAPIHHIPLPRSARRLRSDDGLDELTANLDDTIAQTGPDRIAAIIAEPLLNVAGCIPLPSGALHRLRGA